jgi:hypothetical protein
MTKLNGVKRSIADFNTRKSAEVPFKFEYLLPDGTGSGLILHVLGDNAPAVVAERNRLINEERQRQVAAQAMLKPGQTAPAQPVEKDIEFGDKLAAVRLVGWDGVDDPHTPEAAMELISNSPEIREQVVAASQNLGNFTKR